METFLVGQGCCLTALSGGYGLRFDPRYSGDFSAFCLGADASGVRETGLSYKLEDAVLEASFPLAVSNSFVGETAQISLQTGRLIVYWQDNPGLPMPVRFKI